MPTTSRPAPPDTAPSVETLRVLTWNMHKGRDRKNVPVPMERLAEALASTGADVLLLQEVFHAAEGLAQSVELATLLGMQAAYVPNSRYARGHHGNAILARVAPARVRHRDISTNSYERRGLLHVHLDLPGRPSLHVVNTHLGLNAMQRRRQVRGIAEFVAEHVPEGEPWLLGGDFNDWTSRLDAHVVRRLDARNLLGTRAWRQRSTFPVERPMLPLDRLYGRGIHALDAAVLRGAPWSVLSDHLPLLAHVGWAPA